VDQFNGILPAAAVVMLGDIQRRMADVGDPNTSIIALHRL